MCIPQSSLAAQEAAQPRAGRRTARISGILEHRSERAQVLTVTSRQCEPDISVIGLNGRVTLGRESGQLEAAVTKAMESGARKLVIDLSEVSYIDSTGIGIIAYCFTRISKAGGEALIAGAQGLVLDVFRVTRLDSIIRFFPDAGAACDSLRATGQSV